MFLTRSWFGKVLIFLSIFRVSLFARGLSSELFFLMSVTSNAFEIHRRVYSLTLLRSPSASFYWSDPAFVWTVPTCVVAVFRPYFSPSLSGKGRHVFCVSCRVRRSPRVRVPVVGTSAVLRAALRTRTQLRMTILSLVILLHVMLRFAPSRGSSSKSRPPRGGRGGF